MTVAEIEGKWIDSRFQSSLIERCKHGWNTPVGELTNEQLATYLRQNIALSIIVPEAARRIAANFNDDTEMYDEELEDALKSATER